MNAPPPPQVVSAILARLSQARTAYPDVLVEDREVVAHVASKLEAGANLESLRTNDLFLACGCLRRDPAAIAHVERETFGEIAAAHRRFQNANMQLDDLVQRMREKLFFSSPPAIAAYAGIGALRGWVRASVLNLLLNVVQRETREEPTDAELFEVVIGADSGAEAAYVKLACRSELEAALGSAMRGLDDRERALLRHAFVDGRNVDEVGAIYGVHRATAARWIASARSKLVASTLEDLTRRLGISPSEAQSIVAAGLSGVGSMLLARML